ncbi:MAG: hypothetical protein WBN96_09955 [Gammaproteobacteria bacterium]
MAYKLYPLSSASGRAIPLEVVSPIEHYAIAVPVVAMGAPVVFTSQDIELTMAVLWSNVDVTISFDASTPVSDVDAGQLFLPAHTYLNTALPSQSISVLGSAAGKLHMNIIDLWDSLATEVQQNYG